MMDRRELHRRIDELEREKAQLVEIVNRRGELIVRLMERQGSERAPESSGGYIDVDGLGKGVEMAPAVHAHLLTLTDGVSS
jgi:hypothetical protein